MTKPSLPEEGFVRLDQIIGRGNPIPVGKTAWWEGIKDGIYPEPVKIGKRAVAWRVEDIRTLIVALSNPEKPRVRVPVVAVPSA